MTMKREPKPPMTMDRAARRYGQIRAIEAQIRTIEKEIQAAMVAARAAGKTVKDLRAAKETRLADLRGFARDEGQLPLLPFDDDGPVEDDGPAEDTAH